MPTAKQIEDAIKELNGYSFELGIFAPEAKTDKNGITNAEILFINEFGSGRIPSRPILDKTLEQARLTIVDYAINNCIEGICNKGWGKPEIEAELNKCCVRIEDLARQIIAANDGTFAPNSPATINGGWVKVQNPKKTRITKTGKEVPIKSIYVKGKGDNHPLFDTGIHIANNIRCILIKK